MTDILSGSLRSEGSCVGVIMAGGSGTRFWPLSRTKVPKQFLPLGGESRSLIQATADRIAPLCGEGGVMVVTAAHQADLVREQLPDSVVLSEPYARNTAACIGFAAVTVLDTLGDVPMLCLPADHVVHGQEAISDIYTRAIEIAQSRDVLVTIGIRPSIPETGYGYIQVESPSAQGSVPVTSFVEKPDRETAQRYLAAGTYFWNSGMFVWRPSVILAEIQKHIPGVYAVLEEVRGLMRKGAADEEIGNLYEGIEKVSIDVGVMEKAANVEMLVGDGFMWSDVGSWSSWADVRASLESQEQREVIIDGDGHAVACSGLTVVSKNRFVAAVGLQDVIIVDTDDALLVCSRDDAQRVKEVVQHLSDSQRDELL